MLEIGLILLENWSTSISFYWRFIKTQLDTIPKSFWQYLPNIMNKILDTFSISTVYNGFSSIQRIKFNFEDVFPLHDCKSQTFLLVKWTPCTEYQLKVASTKKYPYKSAYWYPNTFHWSRLFCCAHLYVRSIKQLIQALVSQTRLLCWRLRIALSLILTDLHLSEPILGGVSCIQTLNALWQLWQLLVGVFRCIDICICVLVYLWMYWLAPRTRIHANNRM